jgi:hypothetical protein
MSCRMMFKTTVFAGALGLLIPALILGQTDKSATKEPAIEQKIVETPPPQLGLRYQSGNRKDPFLNPLLLRKQLELRLNQDEEVPRGTPPPGMSGMYIAQVMLLGVSTSEENRTAIFRGTDKRAYFVRSGDKLFDGFIKKIGTDDVLMVRETKLRSGKVLTQDVTKRLRTP